MRKHWNSKPATACRPSLDIEKIKKDEEIVKEKNSERGTQHCFMPVRVFKRPKLHKSAKGYENDIRDNGCHQSAKGKLINKVRYKLGKC